MEYFAGLDVSMEETHVCVLDRDGVITHQAKVASTPADIAQELKKAPACRRVVFETGRMAPMLFHGLADHGAVQKNGRRQLPDRYKSSKPGLPGHGPQRLFVF